LEVLAAEAEIDYSELLLKNLCGGEEVSIVCPFGWNLYDVFPDIGERLSGKIIKERLCVLSGHKKDGNNLLVEELEKIIDYMMYEVRG
jgi:hypothetical protein